MGKEEEEEATLEFQVNMTCNNCVNKVKGVLEGKKEISKYQVDLDTQSVVVTTTLPITEIQSLLESTGKRAVIAGLGLGAAVAMLGGQVGACMENKNVQGVIRFIQTDSNNCVIDGTIDGLTPGEHGLAIHEAGDLSNGCENVGGHFNPSNSRHGGRTDSERHVGDLGNIVANESGRAIFRFSDKLIKVWDIIGRSLVVAEDADDLGKGDSPSSKINGNCGKALSCGIVARSSGLFQNPKRICACDGVTIWDERDRPLTGPGRRKKEHEM